MDWTNEEIPKCSTTNPLWMGILGSIIGGIIVFWLLKSSSQSQLSIGSTGNQQYTNTELWHPVRDNNGKLVDLTVTRDARIGNDSILSANTINTNGSTTTYLPLENMNSQTDNKISNKINVDMLTTSVNQKLEKRWMELNKRITDYERQRRFGFV